MDSIPSWPAAAMHGPMTFEAFVATFSFAVVLCVLFFPRGGLVWGLDLHQPAALAGVRVPVAINRDAALRSW